MTNYAKGIKSTPIAAGRDPEFKDFAIMRVERTDIMGFVVIKVDGKDYYVPAQQLVISVCCHCTLDDVPPQVSNTLRPVR